jgi:DNA-binding MarR family transcriptional regulator
MSETADQNLASSDGRREGTEREDAELPFRVSPSMTLVLQARNLERRLEEDLHAAGLSLRKFGILGHLLSSPGLSFTEIAGRAGITVQSVHTIIGDLMASGWVTTDGTGGRGRTATLRLTESGSERIHAARQIVERIDEETFGRSAEGEWQDLASALRGVTRSVFRTRPEGKAKG